MEWLSRTESLIGKENMNKLQHSTVAVFGIGGVGSYAAEALVRSGIGSIILIDHDTVDPTNINRQLIADTTTIGQKKVDVAKKRYLTINPHLNIMTHSCFFDETNCKEILSTPCDYIIDAIDTVSSKLLLIEQAHKKQISIISSMGTGNKLDANQFQITTIENTSVCPLAKVIRKELKNRNITNVKVLYSKQQPIKTSSRNPSSIAFVPGCAGLLLAGEVVKDIIGKD